MEIKVCTTQVAIVTPGQKKQTEIRKKIVIHLSKRVAPLPFITPALSCMALPLILTQPLI